MKERTLRLGRALSVALFVFLLIAAGTKNALAQYQVAILQHNDTLSAFYGQNALSLAHEAAADGDTITLSSGTFQGCTISKSITIHGAGCVEDTVAHIAPTKIASITYLNKPDGTLPLTIEGVWFANSLNTNGTCNNATFNKCNFLRVYGYVWGLNGTHFNNCIINDCSYSGSDISIVNSVVRFSQYNQANQYAVNVIHNSVLLFDNNRPLNNSWVENSIIITGNGNTVENSTFFNCIGIKTGDASLFEGQLNNSNMEVEDYTEVFETFDGTVTYENLYQLKPEIATSFLGNDGTEVGIYGGMMPYRTRPSYMIIRSTTVAGRTDENDQLNVEIELNTNGD